MRHFLIDYASVRENLNRRLLTVNPLRFAEPLTDSDTIWIFFADNEEYEVFPELLKKFKETACQANIKAKISPFPSEADRDCAVCFLAGMLCMNDDNEIVIISDSEQCQHLIEKIDRKKFGIFWNYSLSDALRAAYMRESARERRLWSQNVKRLLDRMQLAAGYDKALNLIIKHARGISNPGRRKWKTHNRIQNLVRNREQCTEIYQAVLPLLNQIDTWRK